MPEIADARELNGNATEIMDWIRGAGGDASYMLDDDGPVWVETPEGSHKANQGDWIVKDVEGNFYPNTRPHKDEVEEG